jgi:hypothetical protein
MRSEPYILRDIDPFVGGALIGVGGNLLGGLLGASGQKSAARESAALTREALGKQENAALRNDINSIVSLYGQTPEAMKRIRQLLTADQQTQAFGRSARGAGFTAEQQAELADVDRQIAGLQRAQTGSFRNRMGQGSGNRQPANQQLAALQERRKQLMEYAQGDPGTKGMFDAGAFTDTNGGLVSQYQSLVNEASTNRDNTMGMFDTDTRRLINEARALEAGVGKFGKEQTERIKRDAGEATTGAQRQNLATAIRSGNSGSSLFNANNAASRYINRDSQDQIARLDDQRLGMMTQLGSDRINLDANRSGQRTGIGVGLDSQVLQQKGQIPALEQSVLFGPKFGGFSGINYGQFQPATSAGIGTQALGTGIAQAGGSLFGAGLQSYFNQQRRPSGGGQEVNLMRNFPGTFD